MIQAMHAGSKQVQSAVQGERDKVCWDVPSDQRKRRSSWLARKTLAMQKQVKGGRKKICRDKQSGVRDGVCAKSFEEHWLTGGRILCTTLKLREPDAREDKMTQPLQMRGKVPNKHENDKGHALELKVEEIVARHR